jgi:prolyl-tRNA synthetase
MYDSYTFDDSYESLDKSYSLHEKAYRAVFDRCGLKYFVVGAYSGAMGGTGSEEFMVKSEAGEDTVAYCEKCGYAANLEVAQSVINPILRKDKSKENYDISTPNVRSIDELCDFLKINEIETAKSRIYFRDDEPVLVLMSGNEEVNEMKLETVLGGAVRPGQPEELEEISGAEAGSIGPIGFKHRIIADLKLKDANNLYSGANKNNFHIGGIDLKRDVPSLEYFDLRSVQTGEKCINCGSSLDVFKAIELGHIFKLGTKYSEALAVNFLDKNGVAHPIVMGSYGIGIERVLACFVEQNHDDEGIIWGGELAPFDFHIIGLNLKNKKVKETSDKLYDSLSKKGFEVLYDDRTNFQAGFKFNDADLLGVPVQIIIGEKGLEDNSIEVKIRRTGERKKLGIDNLFPQIEEILKNTM